MVLFNLSISLSLLSFSQSPLHFYLPHSPCVYLALLLLLHFSFSLSPSLLSFPTPSLSVEGVSVDSIRCDIDVVEAEWEVCVSELKALCDWVQAQTRVRSLCSELAAVDKVLGEQDQWLSGTNSTRSDEAALRTLRTECQVRTQLLEPSPVTSGLIIAMETTPTETVKHHKSYQHINRCVVKSVYPFVLSVCVSVSSRGWPS